MLKINKKNFNITAIAAYLVAVLFLMQYVFDSVYFALVAVLILLFMAICFKPENIYYAYAFLLPNTYALKFLNNNAALVGYWLIIAVCIMLVLNYKALPIKKNILEALSAHLLVVIVSMAVAMNLELTTALLKFITSILLISYLYINKMLKPEDIIDYYIKGNVFSVVAGIIYYVAKGLTIFNGHFSGIGNDRNYFAITLAFAISVKAVYMFSKKRIEAKDFIELAIMFVGGILTNSRTFPLIVLPATLCIAYLMIRNEKSVVKKVRNILIMIFLIGVIWVLLQNSILRLIERFGNSSVYGANGRIEIWTRYLIRWTSSVRNFFIGRGTDGELLKIGVKVIAEHSTVIQALYSIGCLGTITLLWVYFDLYKMLSEKFSRKKVVMYIPLLCIIVGYCTVNGLYSDNLTFAVIMAAICTSLPYGTTY